MLEPIRVLLVATSAAILAVLLTAEGSGPSRQRSQWKIVFDSRRDGRPEIYMMDADGLNPRRLAQTGIQPVWSPDRTRIAFASNRGGNSDIYIMNADGSDVRRLTHTQGDGRGCFRPAWSADGTWIAFQSNRDFRPGPDTDREYEIYVIGVDGSQLHRLTRNDAVDLHPAWSPDGRQIVFTSDRTGHSEIHLMDADGSHVRQVTRDRKTAARADWSRDGRRIAFMSNRHARDDKDWNAFEIYVMAVEGTDIRRLTYNERRDAVPKWSPDDEQILFQSGTLGPAQNWQDYEIYVMNANGADIRRLTFNQASDTHADW